MCPFNDYLLNYHEIDGGNNVVCRVVGMGNVNLKLHDVTIRKLKEVRHVPELKLHDAWPNRFSIKLKYGELRFTNGDRIIMNGYERNGFYILDR